LKFWRFPAHGHEEETEHLSILTRNDLKNYFHLAVSPDSKRLVVTTSKSFELWDIESGERDGTAIEVIPSSTSSYISSAAYTVDNIVALADWEHKITFWDTITKTCMGEIETHGAAHGMAFSKDGERLALCGYWGCEIWEVKNRSLLQRFLLPDTANPRQNERPSISAPHGNHVAIKQGVKITLLTLASTSEPVKLTALCRGGGAPHITDDGQYLVDGSSAWDISLGFPTPISDLDLGLGLRKLGPLLSYEEGWIYSHSSHSITSTSPVSKPGVPVVPYTEEWLGSFRNWRAHGSKIVVSGLSGTVVIDCAHLL
jgi:hypothetical protein